MERPEMNSRARDLGLALLACVGDARAFNETGIHSTLNWLLETHNTQIKA
jgi:hypothetical protein